MVEGQRPALAAGIDDDGRPGVIGAPGLARGPGEKDRRDRVEARVPGRVRIGAQLSDELDVEAGLLAGLPDGRGLERLAVIDETARERPAGRRVLALDEDDPAAAAAVHDLDDDVHGGERVAKRAAGHRTRLSAAIVGAGSEPCQRLMERKMWKETSPFS